MITGFSVTVKSTSRTHWKRKMQISTSAVIKNLGLQCILPALGSIPVKCKNFCEKTVLDEKFNYNILNASTKFMKQIITFPMQRIGKYET